MAEQSLEDLREWPPQTILKLFELVRPYPILYDEKHKSWTNKTLKGHIWTTIAKCLDPHLTCESFLKLLSMNNGMFSNDYLNSPPLINHCSNSFS